jgi:hypothetical protein
VDAIVFRSFFSGLISKFVFDILQIPSGCSQIFIGCSAPTGYGPDGRFDWASGFMAMWTSNLAWFL